MKIETISLTKLIPSATNMRKTGTNTGIDELAASIVAHGLLQNLQVRPGPNGKFEVVAGGRRLAALKRLAKAKTIAKDAEIACHVLDEADAAEISLAENIMRLPMHPADQYDAFKTLVDQGKGPEEIAARFGCNPAVIQQRLKLACVSPPLLDAYRNENMDLDQLMAFTVSDDHTAQEKVWAELPEWNRHPSTIRRLLTQAHVEANDRLARFVGIEAYAAAGGYVLRDLFEPEHEGYLTDPALLDRLATEKLQREADALHAEGWKWIEILPEIDYQRMRAMARVYPERIQLDAEQQAELDRLTNAHDALVEEHGDEPPEVVLAELEALCDRIDALSAGTVVWDPEDIARAGLIIGVGHGGRLAIERGLVRRDDERAGSSASPHGDGEPKKNEARSQKKEPHSLSDRLVEDLTAHRTAALRMMLVSNADVALTAIVHGLALSLLYRDGVDSCLAVRIDGVDLRGSAETIEETAAAKALVERHDRWRQLLPAAAEDLWAWLLSQETTVRLDLLAHCAGCTVDAVRRPHEDASSGRLVHADQIAAAVNLDMAQWWQPTATSYLGRVPKARILEAMTEGVSREAAENLAKLKKDALVAHAEERLAGTGWLPAILRSPPCAATASA
jgi:ParB family chromosome partitioning protein